MRGAFALAAAAAAALLMATAGSSAPSNDHVAGYGTIAADPLAGDQFWAEASSGPLGEDPRGMVRIRTTINTDNGPVSGTFHGDVSQGCLIVTGNDAIAVGRLPDDEQYSLAGFGTVEYAALVVEDNGHPQHGQPVDRVFPVLLKASSAARACAGVAPPGLAPIDHGNFVVEDALP